MALHWNIEKCKESEKLRSEEEWGITNALIWGTMMVDLGDITEKNLDEWMVRLKVIERIDGPFLRNGEGKAVPLTREMVEKRIGLRTNVGNMTRAAWSKKIMQYMFREAERK